MSAVWADSFVSEDSLTQNITALRRALGDDSAPAGVHLHHPAARLPVHRAARRARRRANRAAAGASGRPRRRRRRRAPSPEAAGRQSRRVGRSGGAFAVGSGRAGAAVAAALVFASTLAATPRRRATAPVRCASPSDAPDGHAAGVGRHPLARRPPPRVHRPGRRHRASAPLGAGTRRRAPRGSSRAPRAPGSRSGRPTARPSASSRPARVKRVGVGGGPVQTLAPMVGLTVSGGTWGQTTSSSLPASGPGVNAVPASGGEVTRGHAPRRGRAGNRAPLAAVPARRPVPVLDLLGERGTGRHLRRQRSDRRNGFACCPIPAACTRRPATCSTSRTAC